MRTSGRQGFALVLAVLALAGAVLVLFFRVGRHDDEARDANLDTIEAARERHQHVIAPVPVPSVVRERSPQSSDLATDDRPDFLEEDADAEPEEHDPASTRSTTVLDRGPPLDPYTPKMIGDEVYDHATLQTAAYKLFDLQDFDAAVTMATRVLEREPEAMRMHLLIVLSACASGNDALAREHHARLPETERARPLVACRRAGIDLADASEPAL